MVQEKKIVDQVSGWLTLYDDGSVDRTWTGPPEFKFMADPVPPHDDFIDSVSVRDVIADETSGLRLRIYQPEPNPEELGAKLPIILHFPGGGFCISEADWFMYYAVYTRLARAARAVVVSVYLRRAPEHRLPAAADDAHAALLWLSSAAQSSAQSGGGNKSHPALGDPDFTRIFLVGDSSGGNLVHAVAARAGRECLAPARLAGAVPIHPGFVRAERSRSEREQPQTPFLTLDMLDKFLGLALPVGSTKDHPLTCPMAAEAELGEARLPATLLCVAERDLVLETEMEYYEAMKKAGKDVELHVSAGMSHSFYLNKVAVDADADTAAQTDGLIAAIVEFIKRH